MQVKDLADAVISMDADLQDDINAIDAMLEEYEKATKSFMASVIIGTQIRHLNVVQQWLFMA